MYLIIQPGHKVAHAVTAELSWHVQNRGPVWSLFIIEEQDMFYMI